MTQQFSYKICFIILVYTCLISRVSYNTCCVSYTRKENLNCLQWADNSSDRGDSFLSVIKSLIPIDETALCKAMDENLPAVFCVQCWNHTINAVNCWLQGYGAVSSEIQVYICHMCDLFHQPSQLPLRIGNLRHKPVTDGM